MVVLLKELCNLLRRVFLMFIFRSIDFFLKTYLEENFLSHEKEIKKRTYCSNFL